MGFGGLFSCWSNSAIRIVCWHLHPYIPYKSFLVMLQEKLENYVSWAILQVGFHIVRTLPMRCFHMGSQRRKREGGRHFFFVCPLAIVGWWIDLLDVQRGVVAILPILELWEAGKVGSSYVHGSDFGWQQLRFSLWPQTWDLWELLLTFAAPVFTIVFF